MIIAKSPLRISFVGGGSDLASYYRKHGGAVISTAIDKYIYVTVNKKFDNTIRLSYSKTEEVTSVQALEHQYVREILTYMGMDGGIEITSIADIPSKGSGLGSSSSFTIAMLQALSAYQGRHISAKKLAELACMIEIEKCGQPIGKQDQYAAAFGGLNFIRFHPDDTVSVDPIICLKDTKEQLSKNLIMLYTGITRSASDILKTQGENLQSDEEKQEIMGKMVNLAYTMKEELEANNLNNFGGLLHENWLLKKQLSGGISTGQIDVWYEKAMRAGALGGKLLGAGGGGFLLFYVPKDRQESVYEALSDLKKVKFDFENEGSKIIFVH